MLNCCDALASSNYLAQRGRTVVSVYRRFATVQRMSGKRGTVCVGSQQSIKSAIRQVYSRHSFKMRAATTAAIASLGMEARLHDSVALIKGRAMHTIASVM